MVTQSKPTAAKIRSAMRKLARFDYPENILDLDLDGVYSNKLGGLSSCVGGFYRLTAPGPYTMVDHRGFGEPRMAYHAVDTPVSPGLGMKAFAKDLGFRGYSPVALMLSWAEENPDLWGNEYGGEMLLRDRAYPFLDEQPLTLGNLIQHWLGVADRLAAREDRDKC